MKKLILILCFKTISVISIFSQAQLGMLQGYSPGLSDTLIKGYPFSFAVKIVNIGNQPFNQFAYLNVQIRDSFGVPYFNFPQIGPDSLSLIPGQQHTVVVSETVHSFLLDGNNTVVIWPYAPDGTESFDTLFLDIYLLDVNALEENPSAHNLIIYPNPATDYLFLQSPIIIEQVRIYDNSGKLIQTKNKTSTIELYSLPQGLYFIEIKVEGFEHTIKRKIIKG